MSGQLSSQHLIPTRQLSSVAAGKRFLSTGIDPLDRMMGGGIPGGDLTELTGAGSSGKTGLLFSILAAACKREETVAYIDAFDCFDPESAQRSEIALNQLLWIRSQGTFMGERVGKALKAADILARSDGFHIIVLDLAPPLISGESPARHIPFQSFYRLKKNLQGKSKALIVVSEESLSGSASSVVLNLLRQGTQWHFPKDPPGGRLPKHACLLRGVFSSLRLVRGKGHGRITLHSHF